MEKSIADMHKFGQSQVMFRFTQFHQKYVLLAVTVLIAVGFIITATYAPSLAFTFLCCGLALALIGWLNYRHQKNIDTLTQYIESLMNPAVQEKDRPALPDARSVQKLDHALTELEQHWQKRLRKLSEELDIEQTVLDILSDPLFLLNSERKVIQANRAAMDLFGSKILLSDMGQLLRDVPAITVVDAVLAGESAQMVEYIWHGPIERVLQMRVAPFRRTWINPFAKDVHHSLQVFENQKDTPVALIVMSDITVLKRAEQSRIDFIANISHELRTPLTSIIGFIETVRGPAKDDSEERDRFLGIMYDQATRMARLVSDLLSLSRIELAEHDPPTEKVDLVRLLGTLLATLELRAAERGMTIQVDSPSQLPVVIGDRDQLIQAFQNLIENAVKYGPEKSTITVTATLHDEGSARPRIAIAVANEGDGIPKEHLNRLTERFYRVENKNTRKIQGTGLGLAIVKHIVNRHRGRLTIASEPGHGAVFTIYLPAAAEELDGKSGI